MDKKILVLAADSPVDMDVDGVKFKMLPMNWLQKSRIAEPFREMANGDISAPLEKLTPIIGGVITSFEDYPNEEARAVFERISDPAIAQKIIIAILESNGLTGSESKNSNSSPVTATSGDDATVRRATKATGNVSGGENSN